MEAKSFVGIREIQDPPLRVGKGGKRKGEVEGRKEFAKDDAKTFVVMSKGGGGVSGDCRSRACVVGGGIKDKYP